MSVPQRLTDVFLHDRDSDRTESIIFPITRYRNVLNAPNIVERIDECPGAPFLLCKTGTVELTEEKIKKLCPSL